MLKHLKLYERQTIGMLITRSTKNLDRSKIHWYISSLSILGMIQFQFYSPSFSPKLYTYHILFVHNMLIF